MATTDHPLVLDLGSVIGPRGPEGPSGVASSSGTPSQSEGTNGDIRIDVTTGTVYHKSGGSWSSIGSILFGPTRYNLDVGGTGTYTDVARVDKYGKLCEIVVLYTIPEAAETPSPWTRHITIGSTTQTATTIFTLPEAVRPGKVVHVTGWLRTAANPYRAQFSIDESGNAYVHHVADFDYGQVQTTEFDATGYSFRLVYFL